MDVIEIRAHSENGRTRPDETKVELAKVYCYNITAL